MTLQALRLVLTAPHSLSQKKERGLGEIHVPPGQKGMLDWPTHFQKSKNADPLFILAVTEEKFAKNQTKTKTQTKQEFLCPRETEA